MKYRSTRDAKQHLGIPPRPTLRALICAIEMPPGVLLDRHRARLPAIDLAIIRHRRLKADHMAG